MIDVVLAGDNAVVVGMAAAALPLDQRRRVIAIGIAAATLMRIAFALVAVELLAIIGLLLAGGILLLWVAWKLWRELEAERRRARREAGLAAGAWSGAQELAEGPTATPKTMGQAIFQIILADVSMSLDNVLAVAGAAHEHPWVMAAGLALSVALMGIAASLIAGLLQKHRWIAYIGLLVIVYVALHMIWQGGYEVAAAVAATSAQP
ncbi:YjbE family putative metal transport protein [Afifella pfennigii]|uniref:YjbE family putative metal transport protein n=1 Tax=Afifella pfennigii TaxID=209897 RepID=UPI0009FC8CFE